MQRKEQAMCFGARKKATTPKTDATPRARRRQRRRERRAAQTPLDEGLAKLRDRLGMSTDEASEEDKKNDRPPAPVTVAATTEYPRVLFYTSDVDGHADPGELVWFWAPSDSPNAPPQERAMLVVGRTRSHGVLGLLISPNSSHKEDPNWMEIGSGHWDRQGRTCWVRLDRLVIVPENALRREGALFPRGRFERIASTLRSRFGWD